MGYCDSGITADRILEHGRLYYDSAALGTAATKGLLTKVESVKDFNGGNPLFDVERVLTYDTQGRTKTTKDITGEIVTVHYTPARGWPGHQADFGQPARAGPPASTWTRPGAW